MANETGLISRSLQIKSVLASEMGFITRSWQIRVDFKEFANEVGFALTKKLVRFLSLA